VLLGLWHDSSLFLTSSNMVSSGSQISFAQFHPLTKSSPDLAAERSWALLPGCRPRISPNEDWESHLQCDECRILALDQPGMHCIGV